MDVRVKFLGGAGSVTGSKYLLEIDNYKLLIDCGLFQGLKSLRLRNWDPFPINPKEINAVVLTHAHLDHTGYLPRLAKEGYAGPVFCTNSTADLLKLLLLDSAKLQEEEAEYAKKKGYSKHSTPQPLYGTSDVNEVLPRVTSFAFNESVKLTDNIIIKFHYAGHILGASMVEVILKGESQTKTILFSGDLGRQNDQILHPPDIIKNADVLFVESTYGNRDCPIDDIKPQLADAINSALKRHGCILIPAFSVGRTQNVLMYIKDLMSEKLIPETEVFMDSPMAIAATEIYRNHSADHKLSEEMMRDDDSFLTLNRNLIVVQSREASIYLNNKKEGAIIISASGMMTGGRVLHHLYNRLPRKNDTLLIVGYQAIGTRGSRLVNREKTIRIFGQDVPVNCHIEQIDGLSAHADKCELFDWLGHFENSPKITFVVHGELESATYMAAKIENDLGWNAVVPEYLESFELFKGI